MMNKSIDWVERALLTMREKGIKRSRLVDRLGISHSTVSLWFSRNREPQNVDTFEAIAEVLGVTPEFLLFGVHTDLSEEERRLVRELRARPDLRKEVMKVAAFYTQRGDAYRA